MMPQYKRNHTYENWARTLKFKPDRFAQPKSEAEVVEIVQDAIAKGHTVRTHGGGHSWSDLIVTDSTLIQLDHLKRGQADVPNRRYTVEAGIRLKDLIEDLAAEGLALKNLGSITEQSIAGAISTGTHGTGLRLQNMSQAIVAMKLVTGKGELLTIGETDTDLLEAARVSLGALGIITEVTIDCDPLNELEYTAYSCKFDTAIEHIDTLNEENDRCLLWWLVPPFGPKDHVIVVTMNKQDTPPGILGGASSVDSEKLGRETLPMDVNEVFRTVGEIVENFFEDLFGAHDDGFHKIIQHTSRYDESLTIPLLPVFHREFEYAIPAEHTRDALRRLKSVIDEGDISTTLPVEVRFVAKDDSLLSPARGQDVCYIGVSTQPNANEVYARVEPIMKDFGGRPHWGKHFALTQPEVAAMYSDSYETFREIRQQLDPEGRLGNTLLRDLLKF